MTTQCVRKAMVFALVAGLGLVMTCSDAQAAFLRWASTPVKTSSVATCFQFAQHALSRKGFASIRKAGSEVTGSKSGAYVAITCVKTAPNATAIVMVISDNDSAATNARDEVIQTIKGVVQID